MLGARTTHVSTRGRGVEFVFPTERDVQGWVERHSRGQVPGRWPYGLDAMQALMADVSIRQVGPPSLSRRLVHRVGLDAVLRSRRSGIGLSWDENSAHRMLLQGRYERSLSGVIWATDRQVGGGRHTARTRRVLERLDGAWVLSEAQLEPLEGLVRRSTELAFIPFGIDADFFGLRPYPARPLVVSIGGDRDRDGATTMAAFEKVASARPGTDFLLQTKADLRSTARVRVVDRLDHVELRDLYGRASVVALASRPNLHVSGMTVSLESMATGRPVVVTGTPGMSTYVEDGITGLHVPPAVPGAMADALIDLLDDPDGAAAMGIAGRQRVEERFTSALMAQRLVDFARPC